MTMTVDNATERRTAAIREAESEARRVRGRIVEACRPKPLPPGEYVYFVQAGVGGPIKIGRSTNPSRRFAELQTASPVKLISLGIMEGDAHVERALHLGLTEVAPEMRLAGEWFAPFQGLLDYIGEITQRWQP